MTKRFLPGITLVVLMCVSIVTSAAIPLDPNTVTKYTDPLPIPRIMMPYAANSYKVGMWPIKHKFNSQLPATPMWGYGETKGIASYPGPTIVAKKGKPISVTWSNNLPTIHLLSDAIDHTLESMMGLPDVRNVVHLHGGDSTPANDGTPDQWYLPGSSVTFNYPNKRDAATLWYHDHAMGITRLNVYAGLAGMYILRDPLVETTMNLPTGKFDIPLILQDKSLNTDGTLAYPTLGVNPDVHPQWTPEFFGDLIVVNGKTWPYLTVEPRKYRFRLLNSSNARMYHLTIPTAPGIPAPVIYQIATDGGYLPNPINTTELLIAPGERIDIVVDFSNIPRGTKLTMLNDAPAPYPNGDLPDPNTTGQVMQFRVGFGLGKDKSTVPTTLVAAPQYPTPLVVRHLMLNEVQGPNGPLRVLINNSAYGNPPTEVPANGSTEIWEIANATADTHPIHLHLVDFHVVNRQLFDVVSYQNAFDALNLGIPEGAGGIIPDVSPFLVGPPIAPDANEVGTNDTIRMHPGQVTRIIASWTDRNGSPLPFDYTVGGYVFHCHILEHEDNDMMRPYHIM